MIPVLTKIASVIAGLAILTTAYFGDWGKGSRGMIFSIAIVIAAAILIAALRYFGST